jgi:hypothetical protein
MRGSRTCGSGCFGLSSEGVEENLEFAGRRDYLYVRTIPRLARTEGRKVVSVETQKMMASRSLNPCCTWKSFHSESGKVL